MTRRDQLIEQMTNSIRERGIGDTTMESVLASSDVTAGSMYHHFPGGKQELAVAAIKKAGDDGADLLERVMKASETSRDGADIFFGALAADLSATKFRMGCPVGVPSTEAATTEPIREIGAKAFESWIAVIARFFEERGADSAAALSTARFVVAAYEGCSTVARTMQDTSIVDDTLTAVRAAIGRLQLD